MFLHQAIAQTLRDLANSEELWAGSEEELLDFLIWMRSPPPFVRDIVRQALFSQEVQAECKRLGIDFSWTEMPIGEVKSDVE